MVLGCKGAGYSRAESRGERSPCQPEEFVRDRGCEAGGLMGSHMATFFR